MARITIEDCLKRVPNRFAIVNLAAKRVREIREGSEYLVSSPKNEDIVVALREIAAGKVSFEKEAEVEIEPEVKADEEVRLEETVEGEETEQAEDKVPEESN